MNPKKNSQQQMVVAALMVLFGLVVMNSLRTLGVFGSRPAPRKAAAATPKAGETLLPDGVKKRQRRVPERAMPDATAGGAAPQARTEDGYTAQALRDPFVDLLPKPAPGSALEPLVAEQPAPPPPQLPSLAVQGTWWGGEGGAAIINGQVYRVGDEISGVTIRGIDHNGVTVEFAGRMVLLTSGAAERGGLSSRGVH